MKDAGFQLRGNLPLPLLPSRSPLILTCHPVLMALIAAWGVGAGETYIPIALSPIHMSQWCENLWGLPDICPYHSSLASWSLSPQLCVYPLPALRSESQLEICLNRVERLPVIWRWLGFSPRMFMRLETAYLVISSVPFSLEKMAPFSILLFREHPVGTTLLDILGVFLKLPGACSQPWGHSSPRKQPAAPSREGPGFSFLATVCGCGVKSVALQTGSSGSRGWGARENPRFIHRLLLDSLSPLLSSLAVFPELLGEVDAALLLWSDLWFAKHFSHCSYTSTYPA